MPKRAPITSSRGTSRRVVGQFDFFLSCFLRASRFSALGPFGQFHRCVAKDVPRRILVLQFGHSMRGFRAGFGCFFLTVGGFNLLRHRGHRQTVCQLPTVSWHAAQTFFPISVMLATLLSHFRNQRCPYILALIVWRRSSS